MEEEANLSPPERQVRLRGGPFDGKRVWWTGGSVLDVPTIDGVNIWNPSTLPRPKKLVFTDVRYVRSQDDPAVFDHAGG